MNIRVGTLENLSAVQQLNARSFQNDAAHDDRLVMTWPTDAQTGAEFFKQRLSNYGEGIAFVALVDGLVVGYVAGAIQPNESYRSGTRSELENMYVNESARRNGVGTALVDRSIGPLQTMEH